MSEREERCGRCRFFRLQPGVTADAVSMGMCRFTPEPRKKVAVDWCGQFQTPEEYKILKDYPDAGDWLESILKIEGVKDA